MTDAFDAPVTDLSQSEPAARAGADLQAGVELQRMILPEALTSRQAADLFSEFQTLRGSSVLIDATAVRQVGTLCLQVLASACRTWKSEGLEFRMSGSSEVLSKQWKLFGLPVGEFAECIDR